jgi:iron complex outermembrane receptor protein
MKKYGGWLLASVCAASVSHAMSATEVTAAQKTPLVSAPAVSDESRLDEIVVTAEKRSESLQNVPIAITAMHADLLEAKGVVSTADLASLAPGLVGIESNGYALPHIRGIGTNLNATGITSPVSVYVDGVYIDSAVGSLFTLNNIDQIEVDKGPQGTLFGRNATGGIIQIITQDPSHEFGGKASIGEDNYATLLSNLYVTGGLTDTLAVDLALHYKDQMQGWGENHLTGRDEYLGKEYDIRSKVLWTPTERDTISLGLDYENANDFYHVLDYPIGYLPYDAFLGDKGRSAGNPWDTNQAIQSPHQMDQYGASVKIKHEFDAVALTDIAAYRRTQNHATYDFALPPADVDGTLNSGYQQVTEELQLSSAANDGLKWTAGAFYLNSVSEDDPYIVGQHGTAALPRGLFGPTAFPTPLAAIAPELNYPGGGSFGTVTTSKQRTNSGALYGQATQEILKQTDLTVGLRYTIDRLNIHGFDGSSGIFEPGQSKTFSKATWRLALDHHFDTDYMAYVSYNRGFRAGTFNDNAPELPATQPEVLDAYALGFKGDFLDHRLRIDTEGFFYDYTNIVMPLFVTVNGSPLQETTNGPKAQLYGVDLDIVGKVTDRLMVSFSAEALHTEFTKFPAGNYYAPNPRGGAIDKKNSVLTGNQLPVAPKFTSDLTVTYKQPTALGNVGVTGSWSHNAGWFDGPDNVFKQNAFDMLNTQVTWDPANAAWRVVLWGRNLKNEIVYSRTSSTAPFGYLATLQAPRTYGISVEYSFGRR